MIVDVWTDVVDMVGWDTVTTNWSDDGGNALEFSRSSADLCTRCSIDGSVSVSSSWVATVTGLSHNQVQLQSHTHDRFYGRFHS
jgi:hypothetical protein